jgi:hypothetical protein
MAPFSGAKFRRGEFGRRFRKGYASYRSASRNSTSGSLEEKRVRVIALGCGLLVTGRRSICRAKRRKLRARSLEFNKSLANHGLAGVPLEGSESHHLKSMMCECRSMHINAMGRRFD